MERIWSRIKKLTSNDFHLKRQQKLHQVTAKEIKKKGMSSCWLHWTQLLGKKGSKMCSSSENNPKTEVELSQTLWVNFPFFYFFF